MDNRVVRLAVEEDAKALQELVHACGLYDPAVDYSDYTQPVLVAEHEGRVVGFVQVLLGKPTSVIMDLGVHPDFQHQGVAQQLIAALETLMKEVGLTTWVTVIADSRRRMQICAEKWGAIPRAKATTYVRNI